MEFLFPRDIVIVFNLKKKTFSSEFWKSNFSWFLKSHSLPFAKLPRLKGLQHNGRIHSRFCAEVSGMTSLETMNMHFGVYELIVSLSLVGGGGRGGNSTEVAYLLLTQQPGFDFQRAHNFFRRKNYRCCWSSWLEESGQWLENVDWTHLVLVSGDFCFHKHDISMEPHKKL